MAVQRAESKARMSVAKIQTFTREKRHTVLPLIYGCLLVMTSVIMFAVDPLNLVTNHMLEFREGSYLSALWEDPPYQLHAEFYVFNYTNVPEYLAGEDPVLRLQELGPFVYKETRTNRNITVDRGRGIARMNPHIALDFIRSRSVAGTRDLRVVVPNIALLAVSTIAADKLGYLANVGAYYSIKALGSKVFRNLTVEEFFWGYHDPLMALGNKILPGWLDFEKIGILDRFYASRTFTAEVDLREETRFSIVSWDGSEGLRENGYTDRNSSTLCNRLHGSYEGLMVSAAAVRARRIPVFRKQACRVYPFVYNSTVDSRAGFQYERFKLEKSAFSRRSPYACECRGRCLPEGYVDISGCYYGFPIALSKPHLLDVDPEHQRQYSGLRPDARVHTSYLNIEPTLGIPVSLSSMVQVNIAVRTAPGNPVTAAVRDKVLPLAWVALSCTEPPTFVVNLLRLRLVVAPPLVVAVEVVLLLLGVAIGARGFTALLRPRYVLVDSGSNKLIPNTPYTNSNISENEGFTDDDAPAKEAVSLLSVKEEDLVNLDLHLPDLVLD